MRVNHLSAGNGVLIGLPFKWILTAALAASMVSTQGMTQTKFGDADTIKVDGKTFRLDGIDAPEFDQLCINAKGEPWPCGAEASNRLRQFVGDRAITCQDIGPDTAYPLRRIGRCSVAETDLHVWLVREGLAINFEPYAKGRHKADEDEAKANARGI